MAHVCRCLRGDAHKIQKRRTYGEGVQDFHSSNPTIFDYVVVEDRLDLKLWMFSEIYQGSPGVSNVFWCVRSSHVH